MLIIPIAPNPIMNRDGTIIYSNAVPEEVNIPQKPAIIHAKYSRYAIVFTSTLIALVMVYLYKKSAFR